jgi:molybdate transport system substrate-binding protein
VFKPTVPDVATDVVVGNVDAGIVWDATVAMPNLRDKLRAIHLPELDTDPNLVTVAVLNSSPRPTAALKFARYLTARDRGLPVFEDFGFRPVEGDVWAERPRLRFFCGAVNRRSIDDIVNDFARREGVDIDIQYNGCGILTGQMKTIDHQDPNLGFPDVYMACDVYYLENVKQWFQEAVNVSDVEIVIAVPKGSTKVKSPADLLKPGVRVAVGDGSQCTIGALTRRLLAAEGLWEKLMEKQQQKGEVVVQKASSSMLVPDVLTGNVDAAVAYISDTLADRDKVDIVRIQSPQNRAIQPFSIARSSEHKQLARRLFKRIVASPEPFENAGFHFRLGQQAEPSGDKGS